MTLTLPTVTAVAIPIFQTNKSRSKLCAIVSSVDSLTGTLVSCSILLSHHSHLAPGDAVRFSKFDQVTNVHQLHLSTTRQVAVLLTQRGQFKASIHYWQWTITSLILNVKACLEQKVKGSSGPENLRLSIALEKGNFWTFSLLHLMEFSLSPFTQSCHYLSH